MNVLRFEQHGHRGVPQGYKTPEIVHWVFLCNYKEDLSVIRASLNALSLQSIGAHRICILMGCEGAEKGALEKIMPLAAEFPEFRKFVVNVHYLQPGEFAGKSANCSSAFRSLCAGAYHATHDERLHAISGELEADYQHWHESPDARALDREPYEALLERGMLTMMDADSIFHPFHFYALEQSYHFDRHLTRNQTIWQAPICNFMNLYSIPAPSRLMSMAVTLHEMASLMHPTRQKLPFSTYTVSATLALSMGGWASDVLCDEWHCYERVFFATRGKCAIAATHYPILCYGVQEDTWWKSVKARFTQAKRHSWAAIESACLFSFWSSVPDHHRPAFLDFFSVFWKMWKLHWVGVMQSSTAVGSAIFQMISMSSGYNMWLIPDGFWNVVAWAIFALVSLLLSVLPIVAIASWYITIRYERLVQQQYREALAWMPMGNLAKRIRARSVAELPTAEPPPPPQPLPTSMPTVDNSSASGGGDKRKVKDETRALLIDIDEPRSDAPFENVDVDAVSNMNTTISPTTTTPATTTTTTTISARYRTPEVPNDTHGFDRQPPLIPADVQQYIDEFLIMPPSTTWQRAKLLFEAIVIMPIASVMYGFLPALIAQSMLPFKRYYTFVVAAKPKKEELIY